MLVFNALWLSAQSTNYYKVRNLDLNHFNLVNVDDGTNDYYAVGSAFDQDSNKVVVYVFRYHSNGTIVWDFAYQLNQIGGRIYGLNACPGDRSTLDQLGVSHRDIVVVGTFVNTTTGYDEIFALEIDGLNGSIKRKREFDFQFSNASFSTSDKHAVAQFVMQKSPDGYLIGGYLTSGHAVDFSDERYGFVLKLNQLLQVQLGLLIDTKWAAQTFTPPIGLSDPPGGFKDFDMVEHMIEIAPNHYFITGSINSSSHSSLYRYHGQGVMALDINGSTHSDFGFSGQPAIATPPGRHVGMNLKYDPTADKVYLLSSDEEVHGPSITHFNNISTSPVLGSHWDVGLNDPSLTAEEFIPQSMLVDLSSSPPYVYVGGLTEDANIVGVANHSPYWTGKFRLDNGTTILANYKEVTNRYYETSYPNSIHTPWIPANLSNVDFLPFSFTPETMIWHPDPLKSTFLQLGYRQAAHFFPLLEFEIGISEITSGIALPCPEPTKAINGTHLIRLRRKDYELDLQLVNKSFIDVRVPDVRRSSRETDFNECE